MRTGTTHQGKQMTLEAQAKPIGYKSERSCTTHQGKKRTLEAEAKAIG